MSTSRRAALLAGGAALLLGNALAQEAPITEPWALRAPASAELRWRGMLNTESAMVAGGPQLGPYPVSGAAGLLAAIFTHGAVVSSIQSTARQREQDEADRVLEPYRPWLAEWKANALWDDVVAQSQGALQLWDGAGAAPAATQVEVQPLLTMARDEGAVLLDLAVTLTSPGAAGLSPRTVRVVSSPVEGAPRVVWNDHRGAALKRTVAAMFGHALEMLRRHPASSPAADRAASAPSMSTVRYVIGPQERMERARVLQRDCRRATLLTLRDELLSVPLKPKAGEECPGAATF